jgi:hypothetical protein
MAKTEPEVLAGALANREEAEIRRKALYTLQLRKTLSG